MCDNCGCGSDSVTYRIAGKDHKHFHSHVHDHNHSHDGVEHTHDHEHGHSHEHNHDGTHTHNHHSHDGQHPHSHEHSHHHNHSQEINLEVNILNKNNLLASRNRGFFEAKNIFTLNLVSSPGSGKTSLLERTIKELKNDVQIYVIEGDQQTMNDANRISDAGAPALQINTGNGCHLDSEMIYNAVKELEVKENSLLIIENVGNLVCPSLFDLGENKRIVVISVTEGDDKPLKYPNMFSTSDICIINKIDLLPYVDFSIDTVKEAALKVNKNIKFIELSVKSGEGISDWYSFLKDNI